MGYSAFLKSTLSIIFDLGSVFSAIEIFFLQIRVTPQPLRTTKQGFYSPKRQNGKSGTKEQGSRTYLLLSIGIGVRRVTLWLKLIAVLPLALYHSLGNTPLSLSHYNVSPHQATKRYRHIGGF